MAKPLLLIKARKLRLRGESVRDIAQKLGVAKSTASLWTRDIILTVEQAQRLKRKMIKGGALGRLKGSLIQKRQRLELIKKMSDEGIKEFKSFSKRELLIAGIALYWAEGTKKNRTVTFCNSDPKLVNFMIKWLGMLFQVKKSDLSLTVGINEIHRKRENVVKRYWSEVTSVPTSQFRKTSFKKVNNRKVYQNFNRHYGTLTVKVLRPAKIYYRLMGLIEGLKYQAA